MVNGHRNKWCWSSHLYAHRQVYLPTLIREASFAVELINTEIYNRLFYREQKLRSVQLCLRVPCHTHTTQRSGTDSRLEKVNGHLHCSNVVWTWQYICTQGLTMPGSACRILSQDQTRENPSVSGGGFHEVPPLSKELLAMHGCWEKRVSFF